MGLSHNMSLLLCCCLIPGSVSERLSYILAALLEDSVFTSWVLMERVSELHYFCSAYTLQSWTLNPLFRLGTIFARESSRMPFCGLECLFCLGRGLFFTIALSLCVFRCLRIFVIFRNLVQMFAYAMCAEWRWAHLLYTLARMFARGFCSHRNASPRLCSSIRICYVIIWFTLSLGRIVDPCQGSLDLAWEVRLSARLRLL